jgi:hypothetical protein
MKKYPKLVIIPERREFHCGECRWFNVHHKSWCLHPSIICEDSPLRKDPSGNTISYEGNDLTPDWCPEIDKKKIKQS